MEPRVRRLNWRNQDLPRQKGWQRLTGQETGVLWSDAARAHYIVPMLWQPSKSSRSKRTPPFGFIVPCNPTLVYQPPSGPLWVHEVKLDGYRIIALRLDAQRNRHGRPIRADRRRLARLPVTSVTFDGEAVVMRPEGRQDFEGLRTKASAAGAAYFAFDVLELEGKDLRSLPLKARREILAKLLSKPPSGMALSEAIDEDGPTVFEHACRRGFEGIVSKRIDRPYQSGACSSWLKTKWSEYSRGEKPLAGGHGLRPGDL